MHHHRVTEVTVEGISTGLYLTLTSVMAWFLKEMVRPIWSFEVLWNKLATTFHLTPPGSFMNRF